MNTNFEKLKNSSDEWYTPKYILDSLCEFDTDPCSAINPLYETAKIMYNRIDDGLSKEWIGKVWLNPPYSRPLVEKFIKKMAEHNNGISLLFNRCDTNMFQNIIFPNASAIFFIKNRVRFIKQDGTVGGTPGCGSVLISFGDECCDILRNCKIDGKFIKLNK